jgi:hypothetical protein
MARNSDKSPSFEPVWADALTEVAGVAAPGLSAGFEQPAVTLSNTIDETMTTWRRAF